MPGCGGCGRDVSHEAIHAPAPQDCIASRLRRFEQGSARCFASMHRASAAKRGLVARTTAALACDGRLTARVHTHWQHRLGVTPHVSRWKGPPQDLHGASSAGSLTACSTARSACCGSRGPFGCAMPFRCARWGHQCKCNANKSSHIQVYRTLRVSHYTLRIYYTMLGFDGIHARMHAQHITST